MPAQAMLELRVPSAYRRIESVQGLRAIAMLCVFSFHAAPFLPGLLQDLFIRLGSVGTNLFFALAGCFAYRSLTVSGHTFLVYVGGRLKRLYPVYFTLLMVYLLGELILRTGRVPLPWSLDHATRLLMDLLMVTALLHEEPIMQMSWALHYIFAFFLLAPALVWATRRLRPERRLLVLVVLWLCVAAVGLVTEIFPPRISHLFLGPILWELRERRTNFGILIAAAITGISLRFTSGLVLAAGSYFVVAAAVWASLREDNRWSRGLSNPSLQWLGLRSYSFYLCHGLPIIAMRLVLPQQLSVVESLAAMCVSLGAAIVITELCYRYVESRWSRSRKPVLAVAPARPLAVR